MIEEAERLRALGATRVSVAEVHPMLSSSNDRARELARSGCPEWTTVRALAQSAGRGRSGRAWISPEGGLYLSVVVRPPFREVELLPLAAGLAVHETLSSFSVDARLKWPNDVVAGDRKIAGVLAEGTSGARGVIWVVLGVGINIRKPRSSALPAATSIEEETGGPLPEPERVAARFLVALSGWYDRLESSGGESVVAAWSAVSLDWAGLLVEGFAGDEVVRGLGRGIDGGGALMLELPDGSVRRLLSGDVRLLRPRGEEDACF